MIFFVFIILFKIIGKLQKKGYENKPYSEIFDMVNYFLNNHLITNKISVLFILL
jgi:hypothetical protein